VGSYPIWVTRGKKLAVKLEFAAKITLAVSSMEFCQEIFDESYIREGLGDGCGHGAMIPLLQNSHIKSSSCSQAACLNLLYAT
jgi:hypothetical protein